MKYLLAAAVLGVCAYVGYRRYRHVPSDCVSAAWLHEQERAGRVEFDGPSWRWPVQKLRDGAGQFNSQRLRKRA